VRWHEDVCISDYHKVNQYPSSSVTKRPRRKSSNRKCRKCGKDPWPNYFYCNSCHTGTYE
jgi:hypothetical protein